MVVPEAYGFKSVKWLQRVELTNELGANDTYRPGNNDLDSPMKTFARFAQVPSRLGQASHSNLRHGPGGHVRAGARGVLGPVAAGEATSEGDGEADPYCLRGDWRAAEIADRPADLGGLGLSAQVQVNEWPPRYTFVHWHARLPGLSAGEYELRCRSVDRNGIAQPMPRPFPKSGRADIQVVKFNVTGA